MAEVCLVAASDQWRHASESFATGLMARKEILT